MSSPFRTLRYLRSWLTRHASVRTRTVTLHRDGSPVEASWTTPEGDAAPLGTWVVLHGLTRTGRHHPTLVRFTRALAATGAGVLVPDVPEWQGLHLAPEATEPTVRAALDWLDGEPRTRDGKKALVGFSFGSPQAIAASGDPTLRDRLAGVVAFGGYLDLERTIRFQLTGEHEWDGRVGHLRPDPYGRWIVAGNHLPDIPEYADHRDVADALLELARAAGDDGVPSWDPSLGPTRIRLRERVAPERWPVFDLLAAPDGSDPRGEPARVLARQLTEAALRTSPRMDVRPRLGDVPGPVHILHGRSDHLIPFTEARRMGAALPADAVAQVTVTALFGHSAQDPFPWTRGIQETAGFFRAMTRILGVV